MHGGSEFDLVCESSAMRLRPIIAIAHRDLRIELRGARGLVLGAITAMLLLPLAAVKFDAPTQQQPQAAREIPIVGELPPDLPPEVVVRPRAPTRIDKLDDGAWQLRGAIPRPLRRALDATDERPVSLQVASKPLHLPGRTLLFALISASIMMGALSESLAGERARRTLSTLLASAVTPLEVVLGKWLAWTGYGTMAALLASGLAIARGAVEPGAWTVSYTHLTLPTNREV